MNYLMKRERESESSAKHNCINNGMVFVALALARELRDSGKQIDQTKLELCKQNG